MHISIQCESQSKKEIYNRYEIDTQTLVFMILNKVRKLLSFDLKHQ
jgi:hypothetical protein